MNSAQPVWCSERGTRHLANKRWSGIHNQLFRSYRFAKSSMVISLIKKIIHFYYQWPMVTVAHLTVNSYKSFIQSLSFLVVMTTNVLCLLEDHSTNIYKNVMSKYICTSNETAVKSIFYFSHYTCKSTESTYAIIRINISFEHICKVSALTPI